MKNNSRILIIMLLIFLTFLGCERKEKNNNVSDLPDVFGTELFNAAYMVYGKESGSDTYDMIFMSKIDIPSDCTVDLQYTGGTFDYECDIVKDDDNNIDEYSMYTITFDVQNICFENEIINIDSIILYYDKANEEEYIELKPQKFTISYVDGNSENMDLYFIGAPMVIPPEMKKLPYEIGIEKEVVIDEIYVANEAFNILNRNDIENISMRKSEDDIEIQFSIEETNLSKYTQYFTSVVFKYTVDGVEYVKMPPNRSVAYNPLTIYDNNLEKYYNEVLLNK